MNSILSQADIEAIRRRYEERYGLYGYSPKTLDWDKGKQDLRFSILTSQQDLRGCHVLDIGCGFGDLNKTLREKTGGDYRYLGVDVVPSFIEEAASRFGGDAVRFTCGDFLALDIPEVDYAVCSGMFNLRMGQGDNKDFIRNVFRKAYDLCRIGFAFDFLSDKVDYTKDMTFHSSPEWILSLAYRLSRNVILCNNYMPFEFSMFVFKDDSFDQGMTIFNRWIEAAGIHG